MEALCTCLHSAYLGHMYVRRLNPTYVPVVQNIGAVAAKHKKKQNGTGVFIWVYTCLHILFYTTGFSDSIGISMDFSILNQSG